jgi:hypothetical protein
MGKAANEPSSKIVTAFTFKSAEVIPVPSVLPGFREV